MNIVSEYDIHKVSDTVFKIGQLNVIDKTFLFNIISLLSKGLKFIPSIYSNFTSMHTFLLDFFDSEFKSFNRSFFFNNKKRKNIESSNLDSNFENDNDNASEDSVDISDVISIESLDYDSILDKFKRSIDTYKLEAISDSFSLIFHLFSFINNQNLKFNLNISKSELHFLKKFLKEKPFKVLECDKNIGLAIMSNEIHDDLCLKMLSDSITYEKLSENPLEEIIKKIKRELFNLKENKDIKSERLFKILLPKDSGLGKFRILPKLHKQKFGLRPIINYQKNPTSNIAKFLEYLLHPYVKKFDSFLKDSQNLLQDSSNLKLNNSAKLYSLDFESLYTNIKLDDALNIITEFARDKIDNDYITIRGLNSILKLFFDSNVFIFNKEFYLQKLGIGMGSSFGPTCANIVVHFYEIKWLYIHKPLYYKRYIDDIFVVIENDLQISSLLESFNYLKLNFVSSECVNFLDLIISIDKITFKLKFSLHVKPTNTHSYLLTSSNHPMHIFKNIPRSLCLRIRKNCSEYNDFLYHAGMTCFYLEKRGYDPIKLSKIVRTIGNIDRNSLIPYKEKKNDIDFSNTVILRLPFDFNYDIFSFSKQLKSLISDKFKMRLFLIKKLQNSLSSLFVHNLKLKDIKLFGYKKCGSNCSICNFGNEKKVLVLENGFYFSFFDKSSCNSEELIYLIKCKRCNVYYIGETGQSIKRRLAGHISNINCYEPFEDGATVVAKHFNLMGHDYETDFSFYVLKTGLITRDERLFYENVFINLFLHFDLKLLNVLENNSRKYSIDITSNFSFFHFSKGPLSD